MSKTTVVFRKWKSTPRTVIALFPGEQWNRRGDVTSYEHVGQHGGADYSAVIRNTVPATAEECAPLRRELEGLGYELEIVARRPAGCVAVA